MLAEEICCCIRSQQCRFAAHSTREEQRVKVLESASL